MASVSIVKIKVRRGTEAERKLITLDVGELGYTTDPESKRLFIGDGVTKGGIAVSCKIFPSIDLGDFSTYNTAQKGDIIYDTASHQLLYVNYIDPNPQNGQNTSEFLNIGPGVDNSTLTFSTAFTGVSGILTVKNSGITETQISSTTFTNGITGGSGRKVGINYDNQKITIVSGKLTVNEGSLNLALFNGSTLPTSSSGLLPGKLWNSGGFVKVV
jgi:hypothetical protein